MKRGAWLCVLLGSACTDLDLDPPPEVIHARFDPDAKVVPMPTNVLRDDQAGTLDLPADDEGLTAAEREFYEYLNTLDGWSSAMSATVEFTAPIDAATVTPETLQVWRWGGTPARVPDVRVALDAEETKLTIDPPRTGWERGATYVVLLRGGAGGVEGKRGEKVECDAAFWFLRQTEALDTPEHERAFPGATHAERADNAAKLEEVRRELAPYFAWFEQRGVPRADVAALWSFTVTTKSELAMDKASQRMPLPMNLLLDPATGRVDLPPAPWDRPTEVEAKAKLAAYTGFGTTMNPLFEFTAPMDEASVVAHTQLWKLGATPSLVPADVTLMGDRRHVIVTPRALPLEEETTYAVVVTEGVRDATGEAAVLMPIGHLLRSRAPVAVDGASQIGAIDDADAARVEKTRQDLAVFLDQIGRDAVFAAWPFTTLAVNEPLDELVRTADRLGTSPQPTVTRHQTPGQALGEFALGIASLFWVGDVVHGTIESPLFLDDRTRGWREDGGYEVKDIAFTMTVPRDPPPGPLKVVVFGHAIMTERRFVLAVGDALARRGFAAISIDFPMHGTRTHCYQGGPLSLIDPATGELTSLESCEPGTTCNEYGRCVDAAGQGNALAQWPLLNYPVASGAAFIEVEHIANTKDHFQQAIIDLGALSRALRQGDWSAATGGLALDTSRLYYAGQSLGGIIGATFVPLAPEIGRAVLNVPGADTVDMFADSTYFGPFIDAFFQREGVEDGSFEAERFMNVARWFMDVVDPQGVAFRMLQGREVMIQMATADFIIPNWSTEWLEELSGAPRRDYVAEHAFLVIPVEPEFARGQDELADFLAGSFAP